MARILFVSQYYPPEPGAAARRISEIASRLAALGHEVTVLTNLPNYPTGIVPAEYQHGKNRTQMIDDVSVVRVPGVIRPNRGFITRLQSYLSFPLAAGLRGARKVGKPDIILVISPPLFTSIGGRILARRLRCPFVFNVADLWPESAIALGAIKKGALSWVAERLEWTTYHRAAAVWVVTQGIRDRLIQRGFDPQRIWTLPSGVSTRVFGQIDRAEARRQLGWDDRFVVLHAGTLGLALDPETILNAAALLRDRQDIRFVLAGDGAARPTLEEGRQRLDLANLDILGAQPLDRIPVLLAAADVALVSLRDLKLFLGTLPVRMYEAMAAGRPILLTAEGIARKLAVEDASAALYVEPENPDALAEAILRVRTEPGLAETLGANGRAYATRYLDRDEMIRTLNAQIEQVIATQGRRRGGKVERFPRMDERQLLPQMQEVATMPAVRALADERDTRR